MDTLSSRERVLKTLNHQEPDRIPLDLGGGATTIQAKAYEELKSFLGFNKPTQCFARYHVDTDPEILQLLNIDTRYVRIKRPDAWQLEMMQSEKGEYFIDEWGIRWLRPPGGIYWDMVDVPLKKGTLEELKFYRWPIGNDPGRVKGLREEALFLKKYFKYCIVGDIPVAAGILDLCCFLRGMENFLMDLMANPPYAMKLIELVTKVQIELYSAYLQEIGDVIDVIVTGDDLGIQNNLLISPKTYREMIKPFQKELIDAIKSLTSAKVFFHSCGSIKKVIPDLIDMGIDILNPVQTTAVDMEPKELKKEFGQDLVFWGAIDTQKVLPFGSPQEVEAFAKKMIEDLGRGGGYVLAPCHNIQAGTPPQNILALYQAYPGKLGMEG